MQINELTDLFFRELKEYNNTTFKNLCDNADMYKCYSSVITRYFIFCEKHPEISQADKNLLYYRLGIDSIAAFFSQYPTSESDELGTFRHQLNKYIDSQILEEESYGT